LADADLAWKLATLERGWGATSIARLGELVDAASLPGFVVVREDDRIGLLTYREDDGEIEVVTIQALVEGRGVGRALLDAAYWHTVQANASRLWLVTTNDNVRAFAFYQRWGMDLQRVIRDGVEASRRVKPSIPTLGGTGIPLRHELEFEVVVERRPEGRRATNRRSER
jgi:ribosomal protein S18 acetylase RimI-like enzyme